MALSNMNHDKRKMDFCLRLVHTLKQHVKRLFDDLIVGQGAPQQKPAGGDTQSATFHDSVLRSLHRNIQSVQRIIREIDSVAEGLKKDDKQLGNFGLLGVDASRDVQVLHQEAVHSYLGHQKSQETAGQLNQLFQRKRRSQMTLDFDPHPAKRAKITTGPAASLSDITACCTEWRGAQLQKLQASCDKVDAAVHIKASIDRLFTAHILLEGGYMPGHVVIHGWEELKHEDKTIDEEVRLTSRHNVFQELTTSASVAMLQFRSMTWSHEKDLLLRFLQWLESFHSLFTEKCSKCNMQLSSGGPLGPLPPCWRDCTTFNNAYHRSCKHL